MGNFTCNMEKKKWHSALDKPHISSDWIKFDQISQNILVRCYNFIYTPPVTLLKFHPTYIVSGVDTLIIFW